jgi:hypothetical protein
MIEMTWPEFGKSHSGNEVCQRKKDEMYLACSIFYLPFVIFAQQCNGQPARRMLLSSIYIPMPTKEYQTDHAPIELKSSYTKPLSRVFDIVTW